jgi:hypothetical protein
MVHFGQFVASYARNAYVQIARPSRVAGECMAEFAGMRACSRDRLDVEARRADCTATAMVEIRST